MTHYHTLGIMTGTSCDGIDGALIITDGQDYIQHITFETQPFETSLANDLKSLAKQACHQDYIDLSDPDVQALEMRYSEAIITFIQTYFNTHKIDLIGLHGQTILHQPHKQSTYQIGNANFISQSLGVDVVANFRQNDMKHGGQGAPLVPLYHQACTTNLAKPLAFINIGGVSNVTFIHNTAELMGFDIGIGNCISDDLCQQYFNIPYDKDGEIAATGTINKNIVFQMAENPIFKQPPPKSFDRNIFNTDLLNELSPQDAIATINYFTAYCIIQADKFYKQPPCIRIISGGGAYNKTLLKHLRALSSAKVLTADEINLNSDAIEAECFAWLAVRSLKKLPLSIPSTTGVHKAVTGGDLHRFNDKK